MFKHLKFFIVWVALAVFLGTGVSTVVAKTKKPVDLVVEEVEVWPGYSSGPLVGPFIKNKGPSTAYDVKICVKPGRNGLKQCQTKKKIGAGKTINCHFIVEGGSRVTVTATKGSVNIEKNLTDNECTVNVPRPKNKLAAKAQRDNRSYFITCHP